MNLVKNILAAHQWFLNNSTENYVHVSSKQKIPYNEVSGYFIPTLLNIGEEDRAKNFADYLVSKQHSEGYWSIGSPYIFDTCMVIDGLSEFPQYKEKTYKAVEWVKKKYGNVGKNFVDPHNKNLHYGMYLRCVYALQKYGLHSDFFKEYLNRKDLCESKGLSHFYAYALEGAIRLCLPTEGFRKDAYDKCFTGMSQMALCNFLLGDFNNGMKILEEVTKYQSLSGGFLGSDGAYFPNEEISWAVKFYIDAFLESQKLWFKNNVDSFLSEFEGGKEDLRLQFISRNINEEDRVLEVGCGKGRYINNLKCHRYACDIADASQYTNAQFKIGSCLRLPHRHNVFDKVICCECLEHSVFVENAIREMLRVLKPNGKLLIIDKDIKDTPNNMNFLHFGEQYIDFEWVKKTHDAEIVEMKAHYLQIPFCGAIITKRSS